MVEGCDSCASGDESDVREGIGLPFIAWEGGEEEDGVARGKGVQVGAGFAVGVALY